MKQEKTLSEVEILQYLYEQGLVDFTGDEEDLTLHSDTTGKDLLNIFRAGYKKGKKDIAKEILDEIEFAQQDPYNGFDGQIFELIPRIIEQKSGFEELK